MMVEIREAKRHANKTRTAPPKLTRKQQEILGKAKRRTRLRWTERKVYSSRNIKLQQVTPASAFCSSETSTVRTR